MSWRSGCGCGRNRLRASADHPARTQGSRCSLTTRRNVEATAQQLGFTLAEIGDRLPAIWDAADPGPALAQVLAVKLQEIDARIAALQALRQTLAERVATDCPLRGAAAAT